MKLEFGSVVTPSASRFTGKEYGDCIGDAYPINLLPNIPCVSIIKMLLVVWWYRDRPCMPWPRARYLKHGVLVVKLFVQRFGINGMRIAAKPSKKGRNAIGR
jgi:hypothetical protein